METLAVPEGQEQSPQKTANIDDNGLMHCNVGHIVHKDRATDRNGQPEEDPTKRNQTGGVPVKQSDLRAQPARFRRAFELLKWVLKDQWFILVFACLILLASQIQVPQPQQEKKRVVITYLAVSVIFFVNGCTLPTKLLMDNYFRWRVHLFVQLQCYLVTSAATFAIVSICATNSRFMDPWLLIGLLIVGAAPTTMSSNVVMTRQAHGNAALTVVQSLIGQILCPFLTPILLQMYLASGAWYTKVLVTGDNYSALYRRVFQQLGLSVFIPLFAGQVVRNVFPKQVETVFVKWKFMKLSSISLLTISWHAFDQAFGSGAFHQLKPTNVVFLIFISMALYFLWLALCFAASIIWLPKKDVIACCYCCPAKALAMVIPLSSVMFINLTPLEQSRLQIPAILFQAFQLLLGSLLTILFRKWIKPDEEKENAEKA